MSSPLRPSIVNTQFVSSLKLFRQFMLYLPPHRFCSELTFKFGAKGDTGIINQPFHFATSEFTKSTHMANFSVCTTTSTNSFGILAMGPFFLGLLPVFALAIMLYTVLFTSFFASLVMPCLLFNQRIVSFAVLPLMMGLTSSIVLASLKAVEYCCLSAS